MNVMKGLATRIAVFFSSFIALGSNVVADVNQNVWDPQAVRRTGQLCPAFPPSSKIYDFVVNDFDGDGKDEVGAIRGGIDYPYGIYIKEILSDSYIYTPQQVSIHDIGPCLFCLDRSPEYHYLTYRVETGRAFFDLYNYKMQRMESLATLFGQDRTGKGFWNGRLAEINMVDLNKDGQEDLLATINTTSDGQPRALLGYDLHSKKELLDIRLAPMAIKTNVVDLQEDGRPEILMALAGASDGPFFGPFSRDSSYLAIFSVQGQLLFKRAFNSVSSYVWFAVADLDGDHNKDIVAISFSMVNQSKEHSKLVVLDGKTFAEKVAVENVLPTFYRSISLCDSDHDGCAELYVSECQNRLRRYTYSPADHKLILEQSAEMPDYPLVQQFQDVDGDDVPELLVFTGNPKRLWFADSRLVPLAFIQFPGQGDHIKAIATDFTNQKELCYLVLDNYDLSVVKVPLEHLYPEADIQLRWQNFCWQLSWQHGLLSLLLFAGLITGFTLLISTRSKKWRAPLIPDSTRVAIAYFDGTNHLVQFNTRFVQFISRSGEEIVNRSFQDLFSQGSWAALQESFNNFNLQKQNHFKQEISVGSLMNLKNIEVELLRAKRAWTILLLTDLSESTQMERIRWWAAMAQRMAHKIKTPLATVLLAIQRMQRTYRKSAPELALNLDTITNSATTEIERVRDIINTFMKFAKLDEPAFVTADFTRVVQDALNEYFKRIPEGVEVKSTFEVEEMPVRIDIKQFEEALYNILDNAVSAIKAEGVVMLSTHFEKHPLNAWGSHNHAILEISDSGAGMDEGQLGHIFEPGYTTRSDGSGMGLVFARNIIESHLGELIVSSHSGMGTTVEIRLPLIDKSGESGEQNNTHIDR
jgi:signal transduction histidine kinase